MTSNAVVYFLILALVFITGHAAARATSPSPTLTLRKRRTSASNASKSGEKADKPADLRVVDEKCNLRDEIPASVRYMTVSGTSSTSQSQGILDEKQDIRELIVGGLLQAQPAAHANDPDQHSLDGLPLFRSKTGEAVSGYTSQSSGESLEDMEKVELRRRRRQELRRSLKVIIPNGQSQGNKRPLLHERSVSDIPAVFDYYANRRFLAHSQDRTPHTPIASLPPESHAHLDPSSLFRQQQPTHPGFANCTGRSLFQPLRRKTSDRTTESERKVEVNASGVSRPSQQSLVRAGPGMRMRFRSGSTSSQTGLLKVGRVDDLWVGETGYF